MKERKIYETPTVTKVDIDLNEPIVSALCMSTADCEPAPDTNS